jgi:hypothetical protein
MAKRLILILALSLLLFAPNDAKAATPTGYRPYANSYLKLALTYALKASQSATSSYPNDAYLAYFYSLYANYYSEASAWLAQYGNTVADLYAYYAYLYSSYGANHARQAYQNSSAANPSGAYYSYLYTYLGNVYAYYAHLFK